MSRPPHVGMLSTGRSARSWVCQFDAPALGPRLAGRQHLVMAGTTIPIDSIPATLGNGALELGILQALVEAGSGSVKVQHVVIHEGQTPADEPCCVPGRGKGCGAWKRVVNANSGHGQVSEGGREATVRIHQGLPGSGEFRRARSIPARSNPLLPARGLAGLPGAGSRRYHGKGLVEIVQPGPTQTKIFLSTDVIMYNTL